MSENCSTVFVIDDDQECRDSVMALAGQMGLVAKPYSSTDAFLDGYDGAAGCLVTELRCRGMSALELLNVMAARDIFLPTVILTAFADVASAVEVMQRGAFSLLEKPFREPELWETIRRALAHDAGVRPVYERKQELQSRMGKLTSSERTVLEFAVAGVPNKTIASRLELSIRTIESRRRKICKKMGAQCLAELVSFVHEAEHQPLRCPHSNHWRHKL